MSLAGPWDKSTTSRDMIAVDVFPLYKSQYHNLYQKQKCWNC